MAATASLAIDASPAPAVDAKQRKILAAARELFLEKGYGSTSMDEVAQRARASKTTVYTRFPSKQALFAAVVGDRSDSAGMDYRPGEFSEMSVRDALMELGRRFLELVGGPEAARLEVIFHAEAASFPDLAEAYRREGPERAIAAVSAYLKDARRLGALELSDVRFAAIQLLVGVKGDPYGIGLGAGSASPSQRQARLGKVVDLFLNGVAKRS